MPDVLAFPNRSAPSGDLPDVAAAALPLFVRLRDALREHARPSPRRRWNVPPLFFFDRKCEAARPARPSGIDRDLADLLDDALTVVAASFEARRAARTVSGLAAAALASPLRPARELAGLLAVADDEIVRVIHPAARTGFRVLVRGIADFSQFHALLADAVTGDPGLGKLPGARPDPRVLAAFRGDDPDPDVTTFPARFQFYRSEALRETGAIPHGFQGKPFWLWGCEPLSTVAAVDDERRVLIGASVFPASWSVGRKFPGLFGELDLLEVLSRDAVLDEIAAIAGRRPDDRLRRAA